MSDGGAELAARVEALVRGLPGVRDLYAAAPVARQAWAQLPGAPTAALVHVTGAADDLEIRVNVGVDPGADAPSTAAAVAAAIRAEVGPGPRIAVRVSRVA